MLPPVIVSLPYHAIYHTIAQHLFSASLSRRYSKGRSGPCAARSVVACSLESPNSGLVGLSETSLGRRPLSPTISSRSWPSRKPSARPKPQTPSNPSTLCRGSIIGPLLLCLFVPLGHPCYTVKRMSRGLVIHPHHPFQKGPTGGTRKPPVGPTKQNNQRTGLTKMPRFTINAAPIPARRFRLREGEHATAPAPLPEDKPVKAPQWGPGLATQTRASGP